MIRANRTASESKNGHCVNNSDLNGIANYIWSIANDVLRDLYVRGKYRDVILPMSVLCRLDAVLEDGKQPVLEMRAALDNAGVVDQDAALRRAAGQAFYNTSPFTLRSLRARSNPQQLRADFEAWLDGFSPNIQDILGRQLTPVMHFIVVRAYLTGGERSITSRRCLVAAPRFIGLRAQQRAGRHSWRRPLIARVQNL